MHRRFYTVKQLKRYLSILLVVCLFLTTAAFAFDPTVFNKNLSSSEYAQLENGETLVRNIGKINKISINPINEDITTLINTIKVLKPKYLVEIIKVLPYEGNEDIFTTLEEVLLDVEGYVGIPYYSVRNETWYDLYSGAVVQKSETTQKEETQTTNVDVVFEMEPFGSVDTHLSVVKTAESLLFESINMTKMAYYGVNAINEKKMKTLIYAFKSGDSVILYGVGAIDAPVIFFIKERVETALVNKIKTFCIYIFDQL